jgi:psp operon transcriptional activator
LLLANYFAGRMAVELGWEEIPVFSSKAVDELERYPWPGNIRELKNVVERAVYRSDSLKIGDIIFDPFMSPYEVRVPDPKPDRPGTDVKPTDQINLTGKSMKEAVWDLKVQLIERALAKSKFNQKKAAKLLGLTYHQFRGLYRQYRKNDE